MMHRKIAGPLRIQSNGSTELSYVLDAASGGCLVKTLTYSVKVIQASPNVTIGMSVSYGPDGDLFGPEQEVFAQTAPSEVPGLLGGATGAVDSNSQVVGQYIRPTIKCGVSSGTADEWALVEIWETRKVV